MNTSESMPGIRATYSRSPPGFRNVTFGIRSKGLFGKKMPCLSQLSGQISSFLHEGRLRNSKADCIEEFMAAAWSACPIENMITNTSVGFCRFV